MTGFMFVTNETFAGLDVFVLSEQRPDQGPAGTGRVCLLQVGQGTNGIDPTQTVQQAAPPQKHGQVVGGAAKGAALEVIGGAISGDAGKGAAGAGVGAAGGAMRGDARRGKQRKLSRKPSRSTAKPVNGC